MWRNTQAQRVNNAHYAMCVEFTIIMVGPVLAAPALIEEKYITEKKQKKGKPHRGESEA